MADFFVDLLNYLIAGLGAILQGLMFLFPDTPFQESTSTPISTPLSWIAWVIPFPTMIGHIGLLAAAIITYYFIRVAARWIKLVRS